MHKQHARARRRALDDPSSAGAKEGSGKCRDARGSAGLPAKQLSLEGGETTATLPQRAAWVMEPLAEREHWRAVGRFLTLPAGKPFPHRAPSGALLFWLRCRRKRAALPDWASPRGVALPPFAGIMPQGEHAGGVGRSWPRTTSKRLSAELLEVARGAYEFSDLERLLPTPNQEEAEDEERDTRPWRV